MTNYKRLIAASLALGLGVAISACSDDPPANTVEVGTCTNDIPSDDPIGEIDSVGCEESHTAEVYAKFDLSGDDYPGDAAVETSAQEGCLGDRFEDYVGVSYQQSEIFAGGIPPNEQTWTDNDDRTVICAAIFDPAIEGSVKGAAR